MDYSNQSYSSKTYTHRQDYYDNDGMRDNDRPGKGGHSKRRRYNSMGGGGHSKSKRMTDRNNFRNENVQRANAYLSDKGEVIVTPGASNDTSGRRERGGLERKNDVLQTRIMELEKAAQNPFGKYGGKNKLRKKDAMTITDRLNSTQINVYLKQNLFPFVKFLPPKWMRYSEK